MFRKLTVTSVTDSCEEGICIAFCETWISIQTSRNILSASGFEEVPKSGDVLFIRGEQGMSDDDLFYSRRIEIRKNLPENEILFTEEV